MLNTKGMTKKKYEKYPAWIIKAIYKKLVKKNMYFASKEAQMKHDIDHSIYGASSTSLNTISGNIIINNESDTIKLQELEELIEEKTGKKYSVEKKTYSYDLTDLIDYIAQKSVDPFWNEALKRFFDKLTDEKHLTPMDLEFEKRLKADRENNINNLSDEELHTAIDNQRKLYKTHFLLRLANNKNKMILNDFCKELTKEYDADELFKKYWTKVQMKVSEE